MFKLKLELSETFKRIIPQINKAFNRTKGKVRSGTLHKKDHYGNIYQDPVTGEEIAERQKDEDTIQRQNEIINLLLQDFENHSISWMLELDSDFRFKYISKKLVPQLNNEDLMGLSVFEYLHGLLPENDSEAADLFVNFISSLRHWKRFKNKVLKISLNNSIRWLSISASPFDISETSDRGWRGVGHDITEQKNLESQLLNKVNFDELTGLPNRTMFKEVLSKSIGNPSDNPNIIMGLMEITGLGKIRSSFGSEIRNSIIKLFIATFYQHMGKEPQLARLDGYEFAFSALNHNVYLMERIHSFVREINKPLSLGTDTFQIEIHMGIALYPEDASSMSSLFHAADLALNSAIELGNRKVIRYQKDLSLRFIQNLTLANDFYTALQSNQFHLLYQAQIDSENKSIVGAEALIRWNHPAMGNISPDRFIPLAENNRFIITLGEWILLRACTDAMNWDGEKRVSINVSTIQLRDPRRFLQIVKKTLNTTHLPPERLILEITESAIFENKEDILDLLTALRELGISIALDDFGTGYSSLAYIQRLPLDELKIDQSFIKALGVEKNAGEIVKVIIELSGSLGLTTVAEGVETEEQASFLEKNGCHWFQGYLYSKPIPQDLFLKEFN